MKGVALRVRMLHKAMGRLNLWMASAAGWLVLVITVITCYGVFMRYVMNRPDTWSFPVSAYLLSFVVFLAVSNALQEQIHVRVDLLYEWFPGRVARWAGVLADAASVGFLWLVALQTWEVFHESWSQGRTDETTLGWQVAAVQWVMPLGAVFLFLTQLLMTASRLLDKPEEEPQVAPDGGPPEVQRDGGEARDGTQRTGANLAS